MKSGEITLENFQAQLLGLPLHRVDAFSPHGWAFIFGKKKLIFLLLHFDNVRPTYDLTPSAMEQTQLPTPHALTEILRDRIVTDIRMIDQEHLLFSFQQDAWQLIVQLAPYLPRLTVYQQQNVLFDSVLGWQPKTPIHSKPSIWLQNPNLSYEGMRLQTQKMEYQQIIAKVLTKKKHRQDALLDDAKKHQHYLGYLQLADAIKINPLQPWSSYPNPNQLPIPASLSVADFKAMNRFYALYKKAKLGVDHVAIQLKENAESINTFTSLYTRLSTATLNDLPAIEANLSELHLISGFKPKPVLVKSEAPYWIMPDQVRFSFGKNAKQNAELTFQIAKKHEIFLHIKGKPGSHVIIHHRAFDHELLVQGAQLVLALANITSGEVTYAKVGSLKATTIPGQVIVKDAKTIKVNANPLIMTTWIANAQRY